MSELPQTDPSAADPSAADRLWPEILWAVRHGESAGNVARDAAYRDRRLAIELGSRDMDVPLSPLGERQSRALGRWLARQKPGERPTVMLASPFLRARQTAALIREAAGLPPAAPGGSGGAFALDERLREKEFGVLDGLTRWGIAERYPEQAEFRRQLGKFYHRPPGGESWCDVILRLRSALDTIALHYAGERVMIVCHQVVVLCLRYLIEGLTEEQILAIDRAGDVANCSLTTYRFDAALGRGGGLRLESYNTVMPLTEEGAEVTAEPRLRSDLAEPARPPGPGQGGS